MAKRLFVGVPLSEEIKEKIKPAVRKLRETGAVLNLVAPENLHFTLKFLGDVEESGVEEIKEKLSLAVKGSKFTFPIKKVGYFPGGERVNTIWLGAESRELRELMKKVNQALNYIREEKREEMPHLTLARVKSGKNKEKLLKVLLEVKDEDFGQMIVDKIILYESELKPEGPVYRVVGEFGLG